jgi:tyrosine-protein kinase Etk/Wzc
VQLLHAKGKEENKEPVNPKLITQWQDLRGTLASQELEMDFSKNRLRSYRQSIDDYKKKHPEILEQSFELSRLTRAKNIYEETYNILLGKLEESKIMAASETGGIKIIDPAYRPDKPIPKNANKFYLAGVIVGLALGLGIGFFLELNDTTIKSSEDVERYLSLPVIGTIPHITIPKGETIKVKRTTSRTNKKETLTQYPKNLVDFSRDESITSEAYRSLRTNILFSSPDKPLKTIMATSSGPHEGKSLTVTNLAMAFAQTGSKVLLIDTDLRRPVIHHLLQLRREPGFCELFLQNINWDDIIRPTKMPNLSVITAGRFTPNPAELIGAYKMNDIIEQLKGKFDIVFFDTPPLVAVTDATILSKKVDGVVLIIKSHRTEREIGRRAVGILQSINSKIIGTVLNDIDLSHRYSSYGYYKYYYHYYQSKKD